MREVISIASRDPEVTEKTFVLTTDNGEFTSDSPVTLFKDGNEWVMKGDSAQAFSMSELKVILEKLESLNGVKKAVKKKVTKKTKKKVR